MVAIQQMAKVISEQVLMMPLYYNYGVKASVSALKGPQATAPAGSATWGVEQWDWN